jgi:hypothetical protein
MTGPLDEIVQFRDRRGKEQESRIRQERVREIRAIVQRLRGCCLRSKEFKWPNKSDLERLDVLVSELVKVVRKRPQIIPWKDYKAVDDHWHFRLRKTLLALVDRATKNAPHRPLEEYNQKLSIISLRKAGEAFFEDYSDVAGGRDPSSIKWTKYDALFRSVRPNMSISLPLRSRVGEAGGTPRLIAYVVFLELFCLDQQWVRKHWRGAWTLTNWITTALQDSSLLDKLGRFMIPAHFGNQVIDATRRLPELLAQNKKEAERARDRKRRRKK